MKVGGLHDFVTDREDLLEDLLAANILSSLWRKSANEEHMIACFRLKGHLLVVQPISDCMHIFRNKVISVIIQ